MTRFLGYFFIGFGTTGMGCLIGLNLIQIFIAVIAMFTVASIVESRLRR